MGVLSQMVLSEVPNKCWLFPDSFLEEILSACYTHCLKKNNNKTQTPISLRADTCSIHVYRKTYIR